MVYSDCQCMAITTRRFLLRAKAGDMDNWRHPSNWLRDPFRFSWAGLNHNKTRGAWDLMPFAENNPMHLKSSNTTTTRTTTNLLSHHQNIATCAKPGPIEIQYFVSSELCRKWREPRKNEFRRVSTVRGTHGGTNICHTWNCSCYSKNVGTMTTRMSLYPHSLNNM